MTGLAARVACGPDCSCHGASEPTTCSDCLYELDAHVVVETPDGPRRRCPSEAEAIAAWGRE